MALRMLDHWTIALSSGALCAALRWPRRPAASAAAAAPAGHAAGPAGALAAVAAPARLGLQLTGALARAGTLAAIPFFPSLVSTANFLVVEVRRWSSASSGDRATCAAS